MRLVEEGGGVLSVNNHLRTGQQPASPAVTDLIPLKRALHCSHYGYPWIWRCQQWQERGVQQRSLDERWSDAVRSGPGVLGLVMQHVASDGNSVWLGMSCLVFACRAMR